ncbi:hypothetical protein CRENBAI_013536 [Crenichthys baileyi]|uniref:Uncharacterized protein n=1 Tax=Crenichthys baileyi TaxID=28760 RepID=A0AAV9RLN4_9TELE
MAVESGDCGEPAQGNRLELLWTVRGGPLEGTWLGLVPQLAKHSAKEVLAIHPLVALQLITETSNTCCALTHKPRRHLVEHG